jgi:beta-lactam-binding protein with PASTA domain
MKLNFLKSRLFFIQLGIALTIIAILTWLTLTSLKWYTHHGEKLKVPDLYGLNIENAIKTIENKKLKYSIYDSTYNAKLEPGTILAQSPKAGAIVKRNRNLFLTINAHKPEQVSFPNIADNSFRQAFELLISNGFTVGKIEYQESEFFNLVLFAKHKGDSIAGGNKISKGSTIDLILGKGKNHQVLIPNLMGIKQNQFNEKIVLSNLNVGTIHFDESVQTREDSLHAKVYKQEPIFDENIRIELGQNINVWLTNDTAVINHADSLAKARLKNIKY